MSSSVVDASGLLALLRGEPGAGVVMQALTEGAVISTVNLAETVTKLVESGVDEAVIRRRLDLLQLETAPFDEEDAFQAGLLRQHTRQAGLSLGDRACLALARRLGIPALTADRSWQSLSVGVEVRLIR